MSVPRMGSSVVMALAIALGACGGYEGSQPAYDPHGGTSSASDGATGSTSTDATGSTADASADAMGSTGDPSTGATSDDTDTTGELNPCPRVRVMVASGDTLNVRPTPSTAQSPIGDLPNNAIVDMLEEVEGETINGSNLWFHIATDTLDGYIFGAFAQCTLDEPLEVPPPDGFWLPLECGFTATSCGAPNCKSLPLELVEVGVPVTGQSVSSQSCP